MYLVGEEDTGDGTPLRKEHLGVNVGLPLLHMLQRGLVVHIKHHQCPHCLLVVHLSQAAKEMRVKG